MTATAAERVYCSSALESWADLARRSALTPFAHPEWILAWREAFAPRSELRPISVVRAGRAAAFAPMLETRDGLRAPANWHTPRFELLAEDRSAQRELCERLLEAAHPRALTVRFLPRETADALAEAAVSARYRLLQRPLTEAPVLETQGRTLTDFESSLKSDFRRDVGRRWRRLGELGDVTVETHDGSERLDSLLTEGFAVEASGWKGEAGTAIVSRPETVRFYTRIAYWAAGRGWLRLTFLRLDGRPIAFSYDLEYANVLHNLKVGYDEAFSRYSPGKLLTSALVERTFGGGLDRYDFNGGPDPYKLSWATGSEPRIVVQAFSPTVGGMGRWITYAVGRPLAKRAVELARR